MTDAIPPGAVEAIAALARAGAQAQEIEGRHFAPDRYGELQRLDLNPALPAPLPFSSLDALVQFLQADLARMEEDLLIHVASAWEVAVYSPLHGPDDAVRACYAKAEHHQALRGFNFNSWTSLEGLAIALQTCFAPGLGRLEDLQKFTASVRSTSEIGTADDGVSQTVQAKRGIAAVQTTAVNNPWALAPWRSFPEIAQPLSPFVLRFEGSGAEMRAALFETGDQRWTLEAIAAIASYLRGELGGSWRVLG